jgi:hypothetical protein
MKKYAAACGISVLLMAGWAGTASAAGCRVALFPFKGPLASEMQDIIVASLPGKCLAVPGSGRGTYTQVAGRLGVGGIIEGRVTRDRVWHLRLWVRTSGSNGELQRAVWGGRRMRDLLMAVQRGAPSSMREMLSGAIGAGGPLPGPVVTVAPTDGAAAAAPSSSGESSSGSGPPSAPEEPPARSRAARPASAENEEPPGRTADVSASGSSTRRSMLEMSVGPRIISRTFTYTDNLSQLPGYTLGSALGVGGDAEAYFTSASRPVDLGAAVAFESSVGAKTQQNGAARDTRMRAYRLGPRIRVPARNFLFALGADYGQHEFAIDIESDTIVPNVRYTFVRPSLGMRVETGGNLSLSLNAAYLNILSVAGLNDKTRFPRITAVGAEVEAAVGYAIDENLEIRVLADLRHYAQDMHVAPGDPYIAGGALDEHFGGSVVITYRLR